MTDCLSSRISANNEKINLRKKASGDAAKITDGGLIYDTLKVTLTGNISDFF